MSEASSRLTNETEQAAVKATNSGEVQYLYSVMNGAIKLDGEGGRECRRGWSGEFVDKHTLTYTEYVGSFVQY